MSGKRTLHFTCKPFTFPQSDYADIVLPTEEELANVLKDIVPDTGQPRSKLKKILEGDMPDGMPRFASGTNPVESFEALKEWEREHIPQSHGWWTNAARYVVAYFAEQMKLLEKGGNGWKDYFTVRWSEPQKVEEPELPSPELPPPELPPPEPRGRVKQSGYIYCFNTIGNRTVYKAGKTNKTKFEERLNDYIGGNKPDIIVAVVFVEDTFNAEKKLIRELKQSGVLTTSREFGREWFKATDDNVTRRHLIISRIMASIVSST